MTPLCTEMEYGDVYRCPKGLAGTESWALPHCSLHSQQNRPLTSLFDCRDFIGGKKPIDGLRGYHETYTVAEEELGMSCQLPGLSGQPPDSCFKLLWMQEGSNLKRGCINLGKPSECEQGSRLRVASFSLMDHHHTTGKYRSSQQLPIC